MLKVKFTSQFKKDYKIAIKRGFDKEKMRTVIELLLGTGENRQKVSSENRHFQSIKNNQS